MELPAASPSAPKPLGPPHQKALETIHCKRLFVVQGKTLDCDSYHQNDAEKLRPYLQDVPEALKELDTYQSNRSQVRAVSYTGSLGLLAALIGVFINGKEEPTLRNVAIFGGLGLAGGSLLYGLTLMRTNESHIQNAVQYHNQKHPERPIELQFNAQWNF